MDVAVELKKKKREFRLPLRNPRGQSTALDQVMSIVTGFRPAARLKAAVQEAAKAIARNQDRWVPGSVEPMSGVSEIPKKAVLCQRAAAFGGQVNLFHLH